MPVDGLEPMTNWCPTVTLTNELIGVLPTGEI